MCCYVDGTPYLWISFCIKKYLPFLVLMFSFIRMYLRVCLCENICMCIYVLYIYIYVTYVHFCLYVEPESSL